MEDETTIVMVVAGVLAAFVFMTVQMKTLKARRQQSLGFVAKPALKKETGPISQHW